MKKNNLLRLLALTLSLLMLLSLSLSVLTGCDDDKNTDTTTEVGSNTDNESSAEAETGSNTDNESSTETETTADLTKMEPKDALTAITDKLSATADGLSKNVEQQIKDGKFSFSMPTNMKVEVAGKLATTVNMGGMNQTTEMALNASVTLAEGGVALTITFPEMADITVICADKTIYLLSATAGAEAEKEKITITDEDLAELLAALNGTSADPAENAELQQFMALLTPLMNVKPEDVFASIEAAVADGNLTINCKGIKTEFATTLTTILGQLGEIGGEAGEALPDEGMDEDFGVEGDSAAELLEMLKSVVWSDVSFSLTVNTEGQILGASFGMDINMSETVEGLGEMSMKYSLSATVTVTRGGQTIAAPADADSYKEAETGEGSILPDLPL